LLGAAKCQKADLLGHFVASASQRTALRAAQNAREYCDQ
jgi:hypothetical protein